jgi:HSP20 family protein
MLMLLRNDPFAELDRTAELLLGRRISSRSDWLALDAYKHGDEYIVRLDVPGVAPDQIEVIVENDTLTVNAERVWQPEEGDTVHISERPYGKLTRQLYLGESLDAENMEASYEYGVLTLRIPLAKSAKPRRIPIAKKEEHKELIETKAS